MFGAAECDELLGILSHAPTMMVLFGFWQLGNRQLFFNEVMPMVHMNEATDPSHYYLDFGKGG